MCVYVYTCMQVCMYMDCCIKASWQPQTENLQQITHTEKKKESKYNVKITHQITRVDIKRQREEKIFTKTSLKQLTKQHQELKY